MYICMSEYVYSVFILHSESYRHERHDDKRRNLIWSKREISKKTISFYKILLSRSPFYSFNKVLLRGPWQCILSLALRHSWTRIEVAANVAMQNSAEISSTFQCKFPRRVTLAAFMGMPLVLDEILITDTVRNVLKIKQ